VLKQILIAALLSTGGTIAMAQERMPEIPADKLTEAQKKASAEFAEGRGYAVRGPFAAMLRSPEVMLRAKAMGDYLRFKSTLAPRLSEMIILITAREWTQQYEWVAHYDIAMKAGLRPQIAAAIRCAPPCRDGRR
jgi:4-carboxymuconolactone decarboxylase